MKNLLIFTLLLFLNKCGKEGFLDSIFGCCTERKPEKNKE